MVFFGVLKCGNHKSFKFLLLFLHPESFFCLLTSSSSSHRKPERYLLIFLLLIVVCTQFILLNDDGKITEIEMCAVKSYNNNFNGTNALNE